jgi:hypothetical protein
MANFADNPSAQNDAFEEVLSCASNASVQLARAQTEVVIIQNLVPKSRPRPPLVRGSWSQISANGPMVETVDEDFWQRRRPWSATPRLKRNSDHAPGCRWFCKRSRIHWC